MADAPCQRMTSPVGVPEEDGMPEEDGVPEEDGGSV